MPRPPLKSVVTTPTQIATLLVNGFNVEKVSQYPNANTIIEASRFDRFGARISYTILFTRDTAYSPIVDTVRQIANERSSEPLIISDFSLSDDLRTYTPEEFFHRLGGIVNTGLILIPEIDKIMDQLGHNKLPQSLDGDPEDLLEEYTKEVLQYCTESPTRRYGADRLFESLPDGVVLLKERSILLFDAKAYANGFEVQADDIRRFKGYVEDFKLRYSTYFGDVLSFIVVSGRFLDSDKSLQNRSDELYKECQCRLSFVTSKDLGQIVALVRSKSDLKNSIVWRNIFSHLVITPNVVLREVRRIEKDRII